MSALTTTTAMDGVLTTLLNKQFVSDLEFTLQHQKFCMKGNLVKGGGGKVLRFNEFAAPGPGSGGPAVGYSGAGQSAITEGSTSANEITHITLTESTATVAEYGEFIKIGKLYELAALEGTRERLRKRLRDGAAASIDSAVRGWAVGTTTVVHATAAQSGGQTTGPSALTALGASTIMLAKKTLFNNLALPIEGVPGHPAGQYAAVITPQQELDVITEVTTLRVYWNQAVVNVPGKMGQEKWVNGYIGSIYGVAVYTTNNYATVTYTSAAQTGFVYADGGLGAASFGQMDAEIIINDVNSPYKNVNSIAWHAMFGGTLLSAARVIRLYSTGA